MGKTCLATKAAAGEPLPCDGYAVTDLNSTPYSRLISGESNPDFPRNYLQALLERVFSSKEEIVLVSTHEQIQKRLVLYGLWFVLVYPMRESKGNTVGLLEARNDHHLALLIDAEFDNFISQLEKQGKCEHLRLQDGEFLEHRVGDIVRRF